MGRSVSKQSLRNTVCRNIQGNMIKHSIVLALCLLSFAEAQRRGGRRQAPRRGRQDAAVGYTAPGDVPVYAASDAVATYEAAGADDALAALGNSIPGVPGEDYPIYAEVPESGFVCDGQVDGGYYADPEAECQAFHICTADGAGGLAKYSFLCPNGTLFNQNYFICDCSTAEELYSLNDEIAAEREALAGASDALGSYEAPADYAAASAPAGDYSVGADEGLGGYEEEGRRGRKLGNRRNNRRGGRSQGRRGNFRG